MRVITIHVLKNNKNKNEHNKFELENSKRDKSRSNISFTVD